MIILIGTCTIPLQQNRGCDENDAWRVRPNAEAIGYLRGNNQIRAPLRFVRFEPYVVPKMSLTGDTTSVWTGQQMDIYIDASLETAREISAPVGRLSGDHGR